MPLNIENINRDTGHFEVHNDKDSIIGYGRVHASKKNGNVTLTFGEAVRYELARGIPIRVPINWLEALYSSNEEHSVSVNAESSN